MASEVKVNKISPASGTSFQIGDSGDTTTLPSGSTVTAAGTINVTGTINNTGTATGFGAIDWQTGDIKTGNFTGVAGKGYFVNSGSGAITANLPASPSAGDQMAVADYGNNASTNAITIGRNGSNIEGSANDYNILEDGAAVNFIYVDATKGWIAISTADADASKSDYVIASGGTESTSGDEKIHIFESSGTFTVTSAGTANGSNTVDYLVIAGGAGGGLSNSGEKGGGGGGAGGFRTNYSPGALPGTDGLSVSAQAYPITIGAGGASSALGSNSIFSSITSAGGGDGGNGVSGSGGPSHSGQAGGSGGGSTKGGAAGSGNTPPVSPSQGNNGGTSAEPVGESGAGGGGAGGVGSNVPGSGGAGGAGGGGTPSQINGVNADRAGGGGGGGHPTGNPPGAGGAGGGGGGGAGGTAGGSPGGSAGSANFGGGGGGASGDTPGATSGNAGGSGYVVIRYKYQN